MKAKDKSALALLLLTVGICGYISYGPKKAAIPEEIILPKTEEPGIDFDPAWHERLEAECTNLLRHAGNTNQSYALGSASELEAELENRIANIRNQIPRLLDDIASLQGTTNLAWLMTRDKVSGSTEFPKYLQARFRPTFEDPLLDLLSDIESGIVVLEDQLNTETTQLASSILEYSQTLEMPRDHSAENLLLEFRRNEQEFQNQAAQISTLTNAGLFGAGMATVFLKPTMALSKNVLGHITGRMATATGIGSAASVADGPFPFGEAVLVGLELGGAIWSGYDLHKAQFVLKKKLNRRLNESLDHVQAQIRQNLYQRIQQNLDRHNLQNQSLVATVLGTPANPTIAGNSRNR
jgi:hypothetical protein